MDHRKRPLGALVRPDGVEFRVWAPQAKRVDLVLETDGRARPMDHVGEYYETRVPGLLAGATYRYRIDQTDAFPDPASRYQPQGVHGPSQVVDPNAYRWRDGAWSGVPQRELVFYELHVGTFTEAGTFRSTAERLPYLKDLGVTAVELMPVGDFPGRWNWGYDPAAFFAPSRAYGTPDDLRGLVDAAHQLGLAVFLDVIYNHFGPDGAYAPVFGHFFTHKHSSPWGDGINLDDEGCEGVRHFFIDNALHWLGEYHFDGLRLDATHALQDDSETHFLAELSAAVEPLQGRRHYLVAEDARNLATLIRPRAKGGYNLDAVWADDFHHQIRNITAGDSDGYFLDFAHTTAADIATTLQQGWFYTGQTSKFDGEPRGTDPSGLALEQFVLCIQNHDQIGNRALGDRLHHSIPLTLYRAASALLLSVPQLPLLFMGQEWAATSPFQFFTDHSPQLGPKVSQGRRDEFAHFTSFQGDVPDPQDPATFQRSKLKWEELQQRDHRGTGQLYRDLLALRRELEDPPQITVHDSRGLTVRRGRHCLLVALAGDLRLPMPPGAQVLLHTEQPEYAVEGEPVEIGDDHAYFPCPAALVCVTDSA